LKILVEYNLLPRLEEVALPFYEHYVVKEQYILKFFKIATRSKHILDLIHSYVWETIVIFP